MPTINSCDYAPTNFLVQAGDTNGRLQDIPTGTLGQQLTSQGAGMLPVWASGSGGGFTSVAVQTFTSSGTFTPTAGMKFCLVQLVGGGGGGGAASGGTTGGGGGGAAGYSQKIFDAATIGGSQSVTIGTGGAGAPNSSSSGTAGTASSFGAFLSCGAGGGGSGPTAGTGGTGSGGNLNSQGSAGTVGAGVSSNPPGGVSFFGGGGYLGSSNPPDAVSFGSGGGGGGAAGGRGADGFCMITEYIG